MRRKNQYGVLPPPQKHLLLVQSCVLQLLPAVRTLEGKCHQAEEYKYIKSFKRVKNLNGENV